jgi:hypothetical protein
LDGDEVAAVLTDAEEVGFDLNEPLAGFASRANGGGAAFDIVGQLAHGLIFPFRRVHWWRLMASAADRMKSAATCGTIALP